MNETQTAPNPASTTDQFRDKASQIKGQFGELAGIAKNAAGEKIATLKDGASSLYKSGVEKACAAKDGAADFVSENPIKSVLVAAGIGLVAGMLLTRRK
jgi:ElaB/YqjD/DUF883 family membrane-anchored ribosome-binding protein